MGKYINLPEATVDEKCLSLVCRGAKKIADAPESYEAIPEGQTLICAGDHRIFQYTAIVYDEGDLRELTSPQRTEPQFWFLFDSSRVGELLETPS